MKTRPLVNLDRTTYVSRVCALVTLSLALAAYGGFEQDHRINNLTFRFDADSFATNNAFGNAIVGSVIRASLQSSCNSIITNGSLSLVFTMPSLTNLSGTAQPALQLGIVNATPVIPFGDAAPYSGKSDLDWWYAPNINEVNIAGLALQQLPASFSSGVLNAGPGRVTFATSPVALGSPLPMSAAFLRAAVGSPSAPLPSTNSFPPGHRPGENLDPALTSFATMTAGQLRGHIAAAAWAATPLPQQILQLGGQPTYTAQNTFLDLLVGGWTYLSVAQVNRAQPDTSDPDAPVAGAGPPYHFSTDLKHRVIGCTDRLGNPVTFRDGLNAAAYSAYFSFTTDRVIVLTPPRILVQDPRHTILLSGDAHSFGSVLVGTNVDLTFTIQNSGLADLTGIALGLDGTDAAMFTVVANPASTVPGANATTSFTIRFSPATPGPKNVSVHIASSDPAQDPFDIALSGNGGEVTPPTLTTTIIPASHTFHLAFTNFPNAPFTVLATTNLALPLSAWTVLGAPTQSGPGLYQFTDPDPANEAPRFYRLRSP